MKYFDPGESKWILLLTSLSLLFGSCSGIKTSTIESQGLDSFELLRYACRPGAAIKSIKGSVWIKAKSKEFSGQFPAIVVVTSTGDFRLDVMNSFGGTEAIITIDPQKNFRVDVPDHPEKSVRSQETWGGIPLQWAPELFLGKIPCPSTQNLLKEQLVFKGNTLSVKVPKNLGKLGLNRHEEAYFYRFVSKPENSSQSPWPSQLRWEIRKDDLVSKVEFTFEDPEDLTQSPKKWSAKTATGEVKVRWKEREIVRE